jgi:protein-S-isoprenylcysteine O-methyltransferase Ste14
VINKIYNSIPDATLISSILIAYFFDRVLPVKKIIPSPANLIGWIIVAAGLGLAIYTLSLLRSNHTSSDPGGVPSMLITTGLYALSRNPMYLAYVITTIGAAIILGSIPAFIAPVICFSVIHVIIIPGEERNLQKIFGQKYEYYQRSVHRWI